MIDETIHLLPANDFATAGFRFGGHRLAAGMTSPGKNFP
jgi:hypothetical protein